MSSQSPEYQARLKEIIATLRGDVAEFGDEISRVEADCLQAHLDSGRKMSPHSEDKCDACVPCLRTFVAERDAALAEVERLRGEIAALRERCAELELSECCGKCGADKLQARVALLERLGNDICDGTKRMTDTIPAWRKAVPLNGSTR